MIAIPCVALTGCAASSGVVPTGNDSFLISRSEKAFATTGSRVKADPLKEANNFCATTGRALEVLNNVQNDMIPFTSDNLAEVRFRCV